MRHCILALNFAVLVGLSCTGAQAPQKEVPQPTIPFEDVGACPFECCTYRAWTVEKPTALRSDRVSTAPIVASLLPNSVVTAVTGVVVTEKAGIARVRAPFEISDAFTKSRIVFNPGDTIFLLHYEGEGLWLCWFHGERVSLGFLDTPGSFASDGEIKNQPTQVKSWPEVQWWIKIKTQDGIEGWTAESAHFAHKDACE